MVRNFNSKGIWNIIKYFAYNICPTVNILCIEELEGTTSLEACRLIPLGKKPGLGPIGVGEVLRRITGKIIMMVYKKDITDGVGPLQLSAGREAVAEAVIHAMQDTIAN